MYQPAMPQWGSGNFGGMAASTAHGSRHSFGAGPAASSASFGTGSGYVASTSFSHGALLATAQPIQSHAFRQFNERPSPGHITPSPESLRAGVGVPGQAGSLSSGVGVQGHSVVKDVECQDQQCAEEECDADECGDEQKPPRDDNYVCGIDRRPFLPVLLVLSTVMGFVCMLLLQLPLCRGMFAWSGGLRIFIWVLYPLTFGTMAYTALCDPGQLRRENNGQNSSFQDNDRGTDEEMALPKRAHKSWLYKLPIRRYDHYCRWLTNCIGLLNHREFVVMLVGLVVVGVLGAILDVVLVMHVTHQGADVWVIDVVLVLHFAYSVGLTALAYPILRLHIGFISRNELAHEWKLNLHYVVYSARTNNTVQVNDLSDDEYNARFDSFLYEASRNSFDRGVAQNCWSFWCFPRWRQSQLGDF